MEPGRNERRLFKILWIALQIAAMAAVAHGLRDAWERMEPPAFSGGLSVVLALLVTATAIRIWEWLWPWGRRLRPGSGVGAPPPDEPGAPEPSGLSAGMRDPMGWALLSVMAYVWMFAALSDDKLGSMERTAGVALGLLGLALSFVAADSIDKPAPRGRAILRVVGKYGPQMMNIPQQLTLVFRGIAVVLIVTGTTMCLWALELIRHPRTLWWGLILLVGGAALLMRTWPRSVTPPERRDRI